MNTEHSPLENFLNAPMIDYYRKHPEKFMEEIFGLKLEPYQKEMLYNLLKKDNMTPVMERKEKSVNNIC